VRQEHSKPVLEKFEVLLLVHLHAVLPQSVFGKTLHCLQVKTCKANGVGPCSYPIALFRAAASENGRR
jgi:hypothetical protein